MIKCIIQYKTINNNIPYEKRIKYNNLFNNIFLTNKSEYNNNNNYISSSLKKPSIHKNFDLIQKQNPIKNLNFEINDYNIYIKPLFIKKIEEKIIHIDNHSKIYMNYIIIKW